MTAFCVGDVVEWTSQSRGRVKRKRGKVLGILHAGYMPVMGSAKKARDHISYIVRVREGRRSREYWPRVSQLALASPMDAEQGGAK